MQILILGGTVFLGRHLVDAALAAGHQVTLFNRGRSGPGLYPQCERLVGDRDGDLAALEGHNFDAVIDTSGYLPKQVELTAQLLADKVDRYVFLSSGSVYAEPVPLGADESAAIASLGDLPDDELSGESYGALKALCEQAAEKFMPGRVLSVRAGLIVGPYDKSERYTYWPRRVAQGGEILAPGPQSRQVQYIDARDLASWVMTCLANGTAGTFNVAGPGEGHDFGALLAACAQAGRAPERQAHGGPPESSPLSPSQPAVTWVNEECLLEQGVGPWMELPLWLPAGSDGLMAMDCSNARNAGLVCRPAAETAADTLAWDQTRTEERGVTVSSVSGATLQVGLTPDREREILNAWHGRAS
ncbi:MAG: 2'-hydroxyisoflavone reductase [Pseudohongiellaceae bacterium]|jgi:2'-hydroxyisoflavone reductase